MKLTRVRHRYKYDHRHTGGVSLEYILREETVSTSDTIRQRGT